jgi:hypothetical protein
MRYADLRPEDPYYPAWRTLARRERRALGALLLFVVGGLVSWSMFDGWLTRNVGDGASVLTIVPWLTCLAVAVVMRAISPCPRCGASFFVRGKYGNGFTRQCLTCRLPLWAPRDPDAMGRRGADLEVGAAQR